MKSTKDPSTTPTPSDLYLHYAPNSFSRTQSYSHFFDKLGFSSTSTSEDMCYAFIADMDDHVQPLSHKFLNRAANREAFKIMVAEFLAEHGPTYWGTSKRDHLEEPNILKGFLCPRDALRADSRLVAVVESFFNYRAHNARSSDTMRPRAKRLNRNIDFTALTGRKTDLIRPSRAVEPKIRQSRWLGRDLPEDEESTEPIRVQDDDQTSIDDTTASPEPLLSQRSSLSDRRSTFLIASAKLGNDAKRARLSHSPHKRESSEDSEAYELPHASRARHLTSILNSPPEQIKSNTNIVILSDDSDTGQKQRRKNTGDRASHNTNRRPDSTTQGQDTRIKDEPLSTDITSRIKLRVKADGPGVKARGPILVDFEVYKTSERLFTSLMSERSLKPEMQKKVSQLTATICGKETCCRRDRLDDWSEICRELRKLWDNRPELFNDRFEIHVMLHVDE